MRARVPKARESEKEAGCFWAPASCSDSLSLSSVVVTAAALVDAALAEARSLNRPC
jgi:hypothetical protein